MTMNAIPVGDQIAAFVPTVGVAAGTPVSNAQLKALWEGIINIIYNDLTTNAQVAPGTFVVAGGGGWPISGQGGPLE